MLQTLLEQAPKPTGLVTFTTYEVADNEVDAYLARMHDVPRETFERAVASLGRKVSQRTFKNKVQNEGLEVLTRLLSGDTTYTGAINYGCLGTGTNAVTAADGQLQTEVFRKLYASRERISLSVTLNYYFSKNDTDGTYEEFGVCIDGTASADSGQFYNRVLTGGWTKSSSVGMTVGVQLDLAAA